MSRPWHEIHNYADLNDPSVKPIFRWFVAVCILLALGVITDFDGFLLLGKYLFYGGCIGLLGHAYFGSYKKDQ